ncbi:unnamed protein product [Schistosoma margrebowiei]|uniref:Uncharacterized protein n=1 Tax=Schistosoma margrebowiei TaxID=48269 RepID=A0AA85A8H5_9TREM|nr:unnamed protein product [Schistosoma margrebowiei]
MISHTCKLYIAVVILCTLSIMKIESATFVVPIGFYETEQMYVNVDGVNISLDHNGLLKMENSHCTTTISLVPPSEEEIATRNGYRDGTYLCRPLQSSQSQEAINQD